MSGHGNAKTKDVETLLGNPKKAIIAMMIPMIVAMVVQTANNLIDSVWVAGLGNSALAAVGFAFPLFFILMSIGQGVGIGASSAIARHLGREDKDMAEKTASQGFYMMLVASIVFAVLLTIIAEPLLILLGAQDVLAETMAYCIPIFIGTPVFLMAGILSSILRAEGAARRSMNIMVIAAVINIILDPIFIYTFGWGMAGAAWATVISSFLPILLVVHWFFVKKDTYLRLRLRAFKFNKEIDWDILKVGVPACAEMVVISIASMIMNVILVMASGDNAVAIYTSGWKIIQLIMIIPMALGSAVVPIFAVAYGAKNSEKLKETYNYSMKIGVLITTIVSIVLFFTAPWVVYMFTYTPETQVLAQEMTDLVRMGCIFLPFLVWSFVGAGFFQAIGKGLYSLITCLIRNGMQLPICLAIALAGSTLSAMWLGVTVAEIVGAIVTGVWSIWLLHNIARKLKPQTFQ